MLLTVFRIPQPTTLPRVACPDTIKLSIGAMTIARGDASELWRTSGSPDVAPSNCVAVEPHAPLVGDLHCNPKKKEEFRELPP